MNKKSQCSAGEEGKKVIDCMPIHRPRFPVNIERSLRGMYTEYLFICPVPATRSSLGTAKTQLKNIEFFTDVQILIPSNKDLLKRFPDLINPA